MCVASHSRYHPPPPQAIGCSFPCRHHRCIIAVKGLWWAVACPPSRAPVNNSAPLGGWGLGGGGSHPSPLKKWGQILLPSARHLEERLKVSQPVSRQASSQSGSQSGKQAGRNTQALFSGWVVGGWGAQLQNKGNKASCEQSVVKWQHTQ